MQQVRKQKVLLAPIQEKFTDYFGSNSYTTVLLFESQTFSTH